MALVWMMGMIVFLGYVGYKAICLERQLRPNRRPVAGNLAAIVEEVAARYRTKCRVYVVPGIGQPFVWGLLRADLSAGGFRTHRRCSQLSQSLARICPCDGWISRHAVQIVAAMFFFHPLSGL
jgi:hypothetical protein